MVKTDLKEIGQSGLLLFSGGFDSTLGTFGLGAFDEELAGLSWDTVYFYRTFGTNSFGTSFGIIRSFTTLPFYGGGTVIGIAAPAGAGIVDDAEGPGGGEEIGGEVGGFRAPTATSTATGFASGWNNPENALSADTDTYATSTTVAATDYRDFDLEIPDGNEITGIAVKIKASADSPGGSIQAELSWDGGTSTTTAEKATEALITTDVVYELGSSSDLWGRGLWTPSEFSNANFRLRVIASPDANMLQLEALQVRVYHETTGGSGPGGGGEI